MRPFAGAPLIALLALAACGTTAAAHDFAHDAGRFEAATPAPVAARPELASDLALAVPPVALAARTPAPAAATGGTHLGAERARILLRSLTLPGWGQATMGRRTSATVFGLVEAGVWTSFTAFRIQERLRKDTYQRTARLFAGIDLSGRDEEYRRIVGSYLSSDEYNLYVVARDAANLYYDDPEAFRAYIAANEVKGVDAWEWNSVESLLRYRRERRDAQRAAKRANAALAVAVANRLFSAAHAARTAGRLEPNAHQWRLEVSPGVGDDAELRVGLRTDF